MRFELTQELVDELVLRVGDYANDTDLALACGVLPGTLAAWLAIGMIPGAPELETELTRRLLCAVAERRQKMQAEALEVEAKSAAGAAIHLKAAATLTEAPVITGPIGEAMRSHGSIQAAAETLEALIEGRDRVFMAVLDKLNLDLVPRKTPRKSKPKPVDLSLEESDTRLDQDGQGKLPV